MDFAGTPARVGPSPLPFRSSVPRLRSPADRHPFSGTTGKGEPGANETSVLAGAFSEASVPAAPQPRRRPESCAQILLVEDNPGDARLTREVFAEGRITNNLHVVSDGVEAMRFLRREGPFTEAPRPGLILLDLNLPRMDGREVLAKIKADPELQSIPVVVLSTSAADRDIAQTYQLHANSFITKPVDLDQFIAVVRSIESFWLTIVRLPHDRR